MNELLIGLVGALVATNQPLAVSNLIQQHAGVSVAVVNPDDPAEKELARVMADDDAAMDEVDRWIRDNSAFTAQGAGESKEALNQRIHTRLDSVRKEYEDFLQRYPNSARGHLAYGTFLNDLGEEVAAAGEYQKSAMLDPKNPAAWNQLGNFCGEHGPLTNAFVDYAKAIELDPAEPLYYRNLATTVYLFRKDAKAFYSLKDDAEVFDKSLALYRKAMQLAPDDFLLATDYAETYYGIRPLRTNDALAAWTNALHVAHDDNEREGVLIHLARIKIAAGRFAEARAQMDEITNGAFTDLKYRLKRSLAEHENALTNSSPAASTNPPAAPAETPGQAP